MTNTTVSLIFEMRISEARLREHAQKRITMIFHSERRMHMRVFDTEGNFVFLTYMRVIDFDLRFSIARKMMDEVKPESKDPQFLYFKIEGLDVAEYLRAWQNPGQTIKMPDKQLEKAKIFRSDDTEVAIVEFRLSSKAKTVNLKILEVKS